MTVGTSLWGDGHDKELDVEKRAELPDAHGNKSIMMLEREHHQISPNVHTSPIANSDVNDCVRNADDRHNGDKQWKI